MRVYTALSPDVQPRFDTIHRVLTAPGMRIHIVPA